MNPPIFEFTPEELYEAPAHGKLWMIMKIHPTDGRWGVRRIRRAGKGRLRTDPEMVWMKPLKERFAEPVVPGKLLFRTGAGTCMLITLNESALVERKRA